MAQSLIDIVAQKNDTSTEERSSFVVGAGPADVVLTPHSNGILSPPMSQAQQFFAPYDSFQILSIGFTLPHGYYLGAGVPSEYSIQGKYAAGATFQLGAQLKEHCVFVNAEMAFGLWVDARTYKTKFQLTCVWDVPALVNMVGMPAALIGTTQYGYFWCKVAHTLPFIA